MKTFIAFMIFLLLWLLLGFIPAAAFMVGFIMAKV
jgi:hypothetical protein